MRICLCFARFCWIALFAASALAQEPGASSQTVRPEIGKPSQAAIELLEIQEGARKRWPKFEKRRPSAHRTPYEKLRGRACPWAGRGRGGRAVHRSPRLRKRGDIAGLARGERRQFLAARGQPVHLMKNYAKTAELAARYFKDGGTEKIGAPRSTSRRSTWAMTSRARPRS